MDEESYPNSGEFPTNSTMDISRVEGNTDYIEENTLSSEDIKKESSNQGQQANPFNPFIKSHQNNSEEAISTQVDLEEEFIKLQYQYDELMANYEESVERANSLHSSILLKEMRLHSIEIKIQGVIDNLSKQNESKLESSIHSLKSILQSISYDYLDEPPELSEIDPEDDSFEEINTSFNCLENQLQENGDLIDQLRDIPNSVLSELDELKSRISALFTTNILLTDVIDGNNQHLSQLSDMVQQKTKEMHELRTAEIDYQEEVQKEFDNAWVQIQQLQSMLLQEQTHAQQLENELMSRGERNGSDMTEEVAALREQIKEAERAIQYLRTELQAQAEERVFETTVGQFSTSNPTAIIACIEGLVARVSLAEARVLTLEERKEGQAKDTNDVSAQYRNMIEKLQKRVEKYKKNEQTYKQLLFGMKETIKNKENELSSIFSMVSGVHKRVVKMWGVC